MEMIEVDKKKFNDVFHLPYHCFNKAEFNGLNIHKCDKLYHWFFKSSKIRLGLISGLKDGLLSSPFSAPFGGLSFLNENVELKHIEQAIDMVLDKCNKERLQFSITLPPLFYNETFVSKSINCLYRKGFEIDCLNLNYVYKLEYFTDDYLSTLAYRSRKSLTKSLNLGYEFIKCQDDGDKKEAYEIIKSHHDVKEYPVRMSWEQVDSTSSVIPVDYFLLKNSEETNIASAIVFHVAEGITQIVYWGDLQELNQYGVMNHLSYEIFKHYKNLNYKYVDLGPSTENSIPNYGLCEFKESIGCKVMPKFSFRYDGTKGPFIKT